MQYLKENTNVKIVFFRFVNFAFKPHSAPGSQKASNHPAFELKDKKEKFNTENTEIKLFSKKEIPNHEFDIDIKDLNDIKEEYFDANEKEEVIIDSNDDIINKDDDVDSHYNDVDFILIGLQQNSIEGSEEIFVDGNEKIENEGNYDDKFSMKSDENYKDEWKWIEEKEQEKTPVEKSKSKGSDQIYKNGWIWFDDLNDQDQYHEKDHEQPVQGDSNYTYKDQGKQIQNMAQDPEQDHLEKMFGEQNQKKAHYEGKDHEGHGPKNQNYKKSASDKNKLFPLLQGSTLPSPATALWNIK